MLKRIWSVTLYVSDLERSRQFYEKVLGLCKKYEYASYVGFECGGVEIGLIPRGNLGIGKDAPTIQFLVDDVDVVYQNLKEQGVVFTIEAHDEPWGGRQARFQDLDGNIFELTQINWQKYFGVASRGM